MRRFASFFLIAAVNATAALAQDAANGEKVFAQCKACHQIGDKATLTTDAGKTYEGRVSFIAAEAEFTPKQIQTEEERVKMVYRIKIEVPNPNHELNNNMPVDARIQLGSS